jgi:glycosyltransferase involved in cell wall biosynthesis
MRRCVVFDVSIVRAGIEFDAAQRMLSSSAFRARLFRLVRSTAADVPPLFLFSRHPSAQILNALAELGAVCVVVSNALPARIESVVEFARQVGARQLFIANLPLVLSDFGILDRFGLFCSETNLSSAELSDLPCRAYAGYAEVEVLRELGGFSGAFKESDLLGPLRAMYEVQKRTAQPLPVELHYGVVPASRILLSDEKDVPEVLINSELGCRILDELICDENVDVTGGLFLQFGTRFSRSMAVQFDRAQDGTSPVHGVERVLFVSLACAYSGAEASLCALIEGLTRHDIGCSAIVPFRGALTRKLAAAGAVVYCPDYPLHVIDAWAYRYLAGVVASARPHVIHFNGVERPEFVALFRHLRLPLVQHVRLHDVSGAAKTLSFADAIICVSRFVERRTRTITGGHPGITTVYNGVAIGSFADCAGQRVTARALLGIPEESKVVLTVARFAPNKRHDLLLSAITPLLHKNSEMRLLLVGDGDAGADSPLASVNKTISDEGIADKVVRLAFLDDIRQALAAADVLVLPSEDEPWARSILEAIASAVPVIAADSGGTPELIEHERTGLLFPKGDAMALRAAIERAITDQQSMHALAGNALAWLREKQFTPGKCAAECIEIYRAAVRTSSATEEDSRKRRSAAHMWTGLDQTNEVGWTTLCE